MPPTHFPKIDEIERLIALKKWFGPLAEFEELAHVQSGDRRFPIIGLTLGAKDRSLPTLGLFGGMHGLEQIGTHVAVAFLEQLAAQLDWDDTLKDLLKQVRIVSIPLLNPAGFSNLTRCNPNGVDLNRNSPVESDTASWLVGGHRYTPHLPWYRGAKGAEMEVESRALIEFARRELFSSKASIAIDLHSGFGMLDRLWYPFAKSTTPFPRIKEVKDIERRLKSSCAYHDYKLEAQSSIYRTHGDLWDYIYELFEATPKSDAKRFIPLTLEMGSWIWVKKRPWQIVRARGMFNPLKPHRYQRTIRRHLPLLDFLLRLTANPAAWVNDS